jgi:malonyl-CoA/methylmalonyl-CoA synthetase
MANPLYDALLAPHADKLTPFLSLLDGSMISHAAFVDQAAQNANALRTLGVQPGDRVAVHI